MSSLPLPIAAFLAGVLSFLSPCVLPLVPGYVSMLSGTSAEAIEAGDRKVRRSVLLNSLMFIFGFSVVFVALGAGATALGQFVGQYKRFLTVAAGILVIIFGLHLTGIFKITSLYSDKRLHNVKGGASPLGAFMIGFAFAFGWTPCVGPILAAVLGLAASEDSASRGIALLAVYSLGLAVPFLLTSLGVDRFLKFYSRFRSHLRQMEIASGVLLVIVGLFLASNRMTWFNSHLSFMTDFIGRIESHLKL
ncbi:MAG: cytochrome c biogenesis CcdA family protein [Terriglobales bacterium]